MPSRAMPTSARSSVDLAARHLHVRIDRRPEGRDAHPRQHDLRRRLDHRVPGDGAVGRGPVRTAAVLRLRPLPASDVRFASARRSSSSPTSPSRDGSCSCSRPRTSPGCPGVPTLFQVLLSLRGLADRELPALRFLTNTAAALPAPTVEAIRRTFPNARLYSMYGLTECKRATYLPPDQLDGAPDVGRHSDPGHRGVGRG